MNWQQLKAFIWLRWRLLINQARRAGRANAILTIILAIAVIVLAVPVFFGSVAIGALALAKAEPTHLLYVWDGIVAAFAFSWSIGLLTELQRSESLSLAKFMHLPVSVNGVFLINYLSSLFCLSLVIFVPVMVGLGLGLVISQGPLLMVALPLSIAFLLMVTALTYQFQGWLAALMSNPRRRRTVIVVVTGVFVLIFQLPNLINFYGPWRKAAGENPGAVLTEQMDKLNRSFQAGEIDAQEHSRRLQELTDNFQQANAEASRRTAESVARTAKIVSLAVPLGWLPLGIMAAAEGQLWPAALAFAGMTTIGSLSLWRAYRTTVRLYRGEFTQRRAPAKTARIKKAKVRSGRAALLETQLPGISEPASAIALAGLRSLWRAPESKMMLMTPLILGFIFGSMLFRFPGDFANQARPLLAIGAIGFALFGMVQLMSNQFGFDRDGFRVFVLCAAPRRDILLGKNLSFLPFALAMSGVLIVIAEVFRPLRFDHLLSMAPQFVSMYLLFCMLTNLISIYAPLAIAAGSLQPARPKLIPVLLQLLMFFFLFPLLELPTLLPLGIEAALAWFGWPGWVPVCLVLAVIECAIVIVVYRFTLSWQGKLLQEREQSILQSVTARVP